MLIQVALKGLYMLFQVASNMNARSTIVPYAQSREYVFSTVSLFSLHHYLRNNEKGILAF